MIDNEARDIPWDQRLVSQAIPLMPAEPGLRGTGCGVGQPPVRSLCKTEDALRRISGAWDTRKTWVARSSACSLAEARRRVLRRALSALFSSAITET